VRGIERSLSLRSDRGLPLIGAGDWNDGLSHAGLDGKGESVWLGMFLFGILSRIVPVLREKGYASLADRYASEAEAMRVAVNEYGWDGEWYIEGTRDDGRPLGGKSEKSGTIFLNPQTWAVLTGIAPPERIESAMKAVRDRLVKPYGALLLAPAFSEVDPYVGYITRYAPGLRENGGVYSHASVWAVMAFAKLGDMETARAIFTGMMPPIRSTADADLYAAEPYVMPGNIDGPDSPYQGRAGWTWYTGSAAWMARIAREITW
jgi:cellobiose phosphorylase